MVDIGALADGIKLGRDGIWYSRTQSAVSYPAEGNVQCAKIEDKSFWFAHRNRCILELVRAHPPPGVIFDVGGGNGYVTQALVGAGFDAVLVEPGSAGANAGRARGLEHVVCSTLEDANFGSASVPAIGLFDVIEHVRDDLRLMQRVHEILVPQGRVYVTVPAYSWLWSAQDIDAGHHRRHSLRSVSALLESASFKVDFATYFFRLLPIPVFLLRTIPTKIGVLRPGTATDRQMAREHGTHCSSAMRRLLEQLLAPEAQRIKRSLPMRFGGSCLLVASKR